MHCIVLSAVIIFLFVSKLWCEVNAIGRSIFWKLDKIVWESVRTGLQSCCAEQNFEAEADVGVSEELKKEATSDVQRQDQSRAPALLEQSR